MPDETPDELRISREQLSETARTVAEAAARQTAAVAAISIRRRTIRSAVIIATIITLIIGGLVAAGVSVLVYNSVNDANLSHQKFNCQTLATVVNVVDGFLVSDAKDRQGQLSTADRAKVVASFGKVIEPKLLKRLTEQQNKLDRETINYWKHTLKPKLDFIAKADCAQFKIVVKHAAKKPRT